MAKRIHIKPARPGLRVVNPETNIPIPEDGARVVPGQYWNRRIADGDVIRVKGGARKQQSRPSGSSSSSSTQQAPSSPTKAKDEQTEG